MDSLWALCSLIVFKPSTLQVFIRSTVSRTHIEAFQQPMQHLWLDKHQHSGVSRYEMSNVLMNVVGLSYEVHNCHQIKIYMVKYALCQIPTG